MPYPAAMTLQLTIFFDLDDLNHFLAEHDWTVRDVTLTVHDASTMKEHTRYASGTGRDVLASSYYLLHPALLQEASTVGQQRPE